MDIEVEETKEVKTIELYCDGACSNNGKPTAKGGWGVVLVYGDYKKEFSGRLPGELQTNQRAEISAVINGLARIFKREKPVKVITDSRYVVMTMTAGWKRKCNHDLWAALDSLVKTFTSIEWEWVKGHADTEYNNRCDELAVAAIKKEEK